MEEPLTSLVPLGDQQAALQLHYSSLAELRSASGLPVFAIEHCLTASQLAHIGEEFRNRVRSDLDLSRHWLLWVAWITEQGYAYDGEEFWNSFERLTPGWTFQHRPQVSSWFKKFQKQFGGVTPTGDWARHFSIIAWPITNAILPRYHQRHFARALYDLRFDLADFDEVNPASIGKLFAATQSHVSTRFAAFLQQHKLAGGIVLALLGEHSSNSTSPIHLPTLGRIVEDLAEIRAAGHWLSEARKIVTHRFKGLGAGSSSSGNALRPARTRSSRCDLKPTLALRLRSADCWCLTMEVPSFRSIGVQSPEIRSHLLNTRCQVSGAPDLKPGQWLLSANRAAVLRSWPSPHRPLISIEDRLPVLDLLLSNEAVLEEKPCWLFRCGQDGVARMVNSGTVRSSSHYILVLRSATPLEPLAILQPCHIECEGIKAFKLSLPASIPNNIAAEIQKLGLTLIRTTRLWPAAMAAKAWDGEGYCEWLTTDAPCFGLSSDYPVSSYDIRLDDEPEEHIDAGSVGMPVFFQLAPLSSGNHVLTVKPRLATSDDAKESTLQLNVRQPEPWTGGVTGHAGLVVNLDPPDNDLESLWQNRLKLSVLGPKNREVSLRLTLERGDGTPISNDQIGEPLTLPAPANECSKRLAQYTQKLDSAWSYLEASAGTLMVQGDELGSINLRFEREVAPLRWITRQNQNRVTLRLIDDSGIEGSTPKLSFYEMTRPLVELPSANIEIMREGFTIEAPGGLYIANHGDYKDEIVVSIPDPSAGFKGLAIAPVVSEIRSGGVTPVRALTLISLWAQSRQAGHLANVRQQTIVQAVCEALFERFCGQDWLQAERAYREDGSDASLDALKARVQSQTGIAAVLVRDFETAEASAAERIAWYAELTTRYGICSDTLLCEAALRLASQPETLIPRLGNSAEQTLVSLAAKPAVVRGARLLAILSARKTASGSVLPRWPW